MLTGTENRSDLDRRVRDLLEGAAATDQRVHVLDRASAAIDCTVAPAKGAGHWDVTARNRVGNTNTIRFEASAITGIVSVDGDVVTRERSDLPATRGDLAFAFGALGSLASRRLTRPERRAVEAAMTALSGLHETLT